MSDPIVIREGDYSDRPCEGSDDCDREPIVTVQNMQCPESVRLCSEHASQAYQELGALLPPLGPRDAQSGWTPEKMEAIQAQGPSFYKISMIPDVLVEDTKP